MYNEDGSVDEHYSQLLQTTMAIVYAAYGYQKALEEFLNDKQKHFDEGEN